MYVCGPTVYQRAHIGNAVPFVIFAWLRNWLRERGYDVTYVHNITDVNDKIYVAANEAGVASADLASQMTGHYMADTDRLELGRPDVEPLATETMDAIIALIGDLVDRGHAYEAGGDVYFRVRSLPSYGELSHRSVEDMDQGEGVEGAGRKADPLDFAVGDEVLRRGTRPVLGVCLGMQGLVTAYGGTVGRVEPAHGEVALVDHDGRGVFAGLAQPLEAVRYHSLAALEVTDCLEVSATTGDVVMGVRHRTLPLEGVQFHPESILSAQGAALVANFLGQR